MGGLAVGTGTLRVDEHQGLGKLNVGDLGVEEVAQERHVELNSGLHAIYAAIGAVKKMVYLRVHLRSRGYPLVILNPGEDEMHVAAYLQGRRSPAARHEGH
jgi:hypothetical protein